MNTNQRKMAMTSLKQLSEKWKIGLELLKSVSNTNFYHTAPTESPPDYQLENSLHKVLNMADDHEEASQTEEAGSDHLITVKQVVKHPVHDYASIPLQMTKKVVMKTTEETNEGRFIMLEPDRPSNRSKKDHDKGK